MDKIIYFGSSEFSKIILENILAAGFKPCLAVTKPDAPKGRGLRVYPTKVSQLARKNKIELIKPANLKENEFIEKINQIESDYIVVADYGKIMPLSLLACPKKMPLGIHPSLLPLYRGAAPIERSLMAGEKITGATLFKINQKVDAGQIILQKKIEIEKEEDYFSLRKKLAILGSQVFIEGMKKLKSNRFQLKPQEESRITFAPRLNKKEGKINWQKSAEEIKNLIKATLGWPTAYTYYQGKILKITESEALLEQSREKVSTVYKIDKKGIYVSTGAGTIKIKKLKPEGKNEMPAWDFACGHKIRPGEKL